MSDKKLRMYMATLPEVTIDFPFGPEVEVYRIAEKMFALFATDKTVSQVNLKCDPNEALMLRDIFPSIIPGYHMNKKHWNTVILNGSVPLRELERMVNNSYLLVVKGLPTTKRKGLYLRNGGLPPYASN